MPLIEYRCDGCGARSEDLVLAGDVPITPTCPACGSHLSRLLSSFSARSGGFKTSAASEPPCGAGACAMPDSCGGGLCEMPGGMGGMSGGGDWN